jgi:AcrR family transcriptional regulator
VTADARTRIVDAAASLLARDGRDAVTTRAVAAAAGVQAPTIYRLFGDKGGLLEAVAERGYAAFLAEKAVREPGPDPVQDLRAGWDLHAAFGLANPDLYALMYADPRPGVAPAASAAAEQMLAEHIGRVAAAGRLRVSERRAADLLRACGRGAVLATLATPVEDRDPRMLTDAREAVIAAITTDPPAVDGTGPAALATALRAALPRGGALSEAERRLLAEWLDRLADAA